MLHYHLAIPADNINFTFFSGVGWSTLCLITLAFGLMQAHAVSRMSTQWFVILLIMAAGPAVYAIARGYLNHTQPTDHGVA